MNCRRVENEVCEAEKWRNENTEKVNLTNELTFWQLRRVRDRSGKKGRISEG